MRTDSRPSRQVALFALPLALWAAVPTLQFCSIRWDQVRPECVRACATEDRACAAVPADRACGAGCTTSAPACGEACAPHRAYCPGGPNGGAGVRPHPPRLRDLTPVPTVFAAAHELASPPREVRRVIPQLAVRPPPRFWITRPPVRGPPVA